MKKVLGVLLVLCVAAPVMADVQLNISSGFNMDAICGALEFQEIIAYRDAYDPNRDLQELQGSLGQGVGRSVFTWNDHMIGAASSPSGLTYSIDGWGSHPRYATNAQALPENGVIAGSSYTYHMASHAGNATLPGDWTQVANPTAGPPELIPNMATMSNTMYIYSTSSTTQDLSQTAALPVAQQGQYVAINFVLGASGAMNYGARNLQIVAIYGDASEDILYTFANTADRVGPVIDDSQGDVYVAADFNVVEQFTHVYNSSAGTYGNWGSNAGSLFEFAEALALDPNRTLVGIRIEDNSASGLSDGDRRGLAIFAASGELVPEPATMGLLGLGIVGLVMRRRKK